MASAAEAAIELQAIVPAPAHCMSVLCFVRDEPLSGWARDVMVCSTANLAEMLISRPVVLGPEGVHAAVGAVRAGTVRRAAAPVAQRSTRAPKKRSKPGVALVGALVLLAAIWSGGLTKASEWFGEQLVGVIADTPAQPTPTKSPKQQDKKQRQDEQQQRDEKQSR